jgi:RNA 2',3'-cyclic 3'-phosphodiesterase
MYRLFIAIDLPDEVKDHLANMCYGVPGAKWAPKDQMHLTIRFIGEVDDPGYQAVSEGLTDVTLSRFAISMKGVGYFPPRNQPKVLWAGLEKSEALMELRRCVETSLREAGIEPEERKFAAHVTLARLSPNTPLRAITDFLSANGLFSVPSVPIEEFHLYSSVLTNSGPIHRREASFGLL